MPDPSPVWGNKKGALQIARGSANKRNKNAGTVFYLLRRNCNFSGRQLIAMEWQALQQQRYYVLHYNR